MATKKSDWIYLGVGLVSTWWLTQQQNGDNPQLKLMWSLVRACRVIRLAAYKVENAVLKEIDKELDSYGH